MLNRPSCLARSPMHPLLFSDVLLFFLVNSQRFFQIALLPASQPAFRPNNSKAKSEWSVPKVAISPLFIISY